MSEMTATRMGHPLRLATLAALAGAWAVAAVFLWDSSHVPGSIHVGGLDPHAFFSSALLNKGADYEQFLRVVSLLATAATIVVFLLYARFGTRFMDKIAVGPEAADVIDIEASPSENVRQVAKAKGMHPEDVSVVVLDRDRHESLIAELRECGAKVRLITDGDVAPSIAAARPGTGVDMRRTTLATGLPAAVVGILA